MVLKINSNRKILEAGSSKKMNRTEIFNKIWNEQDRAYELMFEYDSMPHKYGENIVLYQAEGELVDEVALHPDITVTELASILKKLQVPVHNWFAS